MGLPPLRVAWGDLREVDIEGLAAHNSTIIGPNFNPNTPFGEAFADLLQVRYGVKTIPTGKGPFYGIVVRNLTAESLKDPDHVFDMSSNSGISQKSIPTRSLNRKNLAKLLVYVPSHHRHIEMPASADDIKFINAAAQFESIEAKKNGGDFFALKPGQLVMVMIKSPESGVVSVTGDISGYAVYVPDGTTPFLSRSVARPQNSFFKPCPSPILIRGSGAKKIAVKTYSSTNNRFAQNIKYHNKTGLFGDGSPQTKAHFVAALRQNMTSNTGISGPTPGPENAFIWVGYLRANGQYDVFDRHQSKSRETIIYAPRHFDPAGPFEIKYYFHDQGGFGSAWSKGPLTKIEEAATLEMGGVDKDNDFVTKINPAIKDLIKQKTNFILVIPELAHSYGFGTNPDTGKIPFKGGINHSPSPNREKVARNYLNLSKPGVRASVQQYLDTLTANVGEDLSQITRLNGRHINSFDGSIAGGNFSQYHNQVLDIIENYLGAQSANLEYSSIVADGAGSRTLAAMGIKDIPSAQRVDAQAAFFNTALVAKIKRFDFIERNQSTTGVSYGIFTGGGAARDFYDGFIEPLAAAGVFRVTYNYVAPPGSSARAAKKFFDSLNNNQDKFSTSNNSSEGKQFSVLPTNDPSSLAVNLILGKAEFGQPGKTDPLSSIAFKFVDNDQTASRPPVRKQSALPLITPNEMPDHAGAVARKTGGAAEVSLLSQRENLQKNIVFFEAAINKVYSSGAGGAPNPRLAFCQTEGDDPLSNQFKRYCAGGSVDTSENSNLVLEFGLYLENLKNDFIYDNLIQFSRIYKNIGANKKRLKQFIKTNNEQAPDKELIKENLAKIYSPIAAYDSEPDSVDDLWKQLKSKTSNLFYAMGFRIYPGAQFTSLEQMRSFLGISTAQEVIDQARLAAQIYGSIEAFNLRKKILNDLQEELKKKNVEDIPPECEPPPVRIYDLLPLQVPLSLDSMSIIPVDPCNSNGIRLIQAFGDNFYLAPSEFVAESDRRRIKRGSIQELFDAIPYLPSKIEFNFTARQAVYGSLDDGTRLTINTKTSSQNTKINNVVHKKFSVYDNVYDTKSPLVESIKDPNAAKFEISSFNYKRRAANNAVSTERNGPKVWSCLTRKISLAWDRACQMSGYTPFKVTEGIIGHPDQFSNLPVAYEAGLDPLAYGLGFEVDPFLKERDRNPALMQHSIWTGAWTPFIVNNTDNFRQLKDYGVFENNQADLKRNLKNINDIKNTFGYSEPPDGEELPNLDNTPICPISGNPTLWIIIFCESSGFVWCNSKFLKTRFNGASTRPPAAYSSQEKADLARIYGIPNVVDRINAISWSPVSEFNRRDNHCRLQFFNGANTLITFENVLKYKSTNF